MFTIDTNVWINGDSPTENHYASSRAFLDHVAHQQLKVVVPTLLRVEIAGTISRLNGNPGKAEVFSKAISGLPFVHWIQLDIKFSEIAAILAANHKLRGADAVYAAVASEYGCKLVSLDSEHLKRLTSVLEVMTPDQALAQLTQAKS